MVYIVEINIICLFLLAFTFSSLYAKGERSVTNLYYKWCIVCAAVCVVTDIAFQFIESSPLLGTKGFALLNFADNLIYYVSAVATGFFWFMFAEYSIDGWAKNKKRAGALCFIPVALNLVLGVASYWTGVLFSIDSTGHYMRGSMFYINTISCYLYTVAASLHALIKSFSAESIMKKNEYRIIAGYVIFPFVIGILQIAFPNVPTVCLAMTLPIVYVHTRLQDLKVSTDYLTNMNNRNQLMRYLTGRFRNNPENLYLFMMDIDKFKSINDTYGHTEGDKALISTADKLKEVAREFGGIIARYGGDEFTYATELPNKNVDDVKRLIEEKMLEASERHTFDIRLSVGSALYQEGMKISELIAKADDALYEDKKRKKS